MATELAKAYVQIVPSAKGIQGSISQALGGEAGAAGSSAGRTLGGKLVSTLTAAIAAAGIGAALVRTITEGAALEQSLGGIETLFKDSADTVKAAAAEAYRTAGLSANAYMESVTGFSARLLQGLGGDTQAAARLADTAMQDMADNANKMGTDMAMVQETYQSLARGNYEMLDNLKLGYGGTQTEMARLINDSGVLGDTMVATAENVNSIGFDKVIEAIHAVQEDMGITGTTAKEAAETLTGSLNAMKAAFSNVLGNLTLGQDVGPALSALAETVTTFLVGNLLPAVWNILRALPGALVTFVASAAPQLAAALSDFAPQVAAQIAAGAPEMLASAEQLLNSFVTGATAQLPNVLAGMEQIVSGLLDTISAHLPDLLERGGTLIAALADGLLQSLPQLITTAGTLLAKFVSFFAENQPTLLRSGMRLLGDLASGILSNLPQIVAAAASVIAQYVATTAQNLPQVLQSGIELIAQLVAGLIRAIPSVVAAVPQIIASIVTAFAQYDWAGIGSEIIRGIAAGIANGVGSIISAAREAASAALHAAKGFLGIASPSRLMRDEVGRFIPAGIAEGIAANTRPLTSEMQRLAAMTAVSAQADLSMRLAAAPVPAAAAGGSIALYQTINTHDSLSPAEMTREAENFLTRARWKNP